jgi:large subunit ribosomal protein L4
MAGKNVGEITLSDAVFGIKPNAVVMHMAVVNYLANQRQGTQSTLTRTEVSGGGKKPWRQKGTGHARQGSIRAPQWRHGGVALGPKPRDYGYSINKKTKRLMKNNEKYIRSLVSDVKRLGAVGINLRFKAVSKKMVDIFRQEGLMVSVWTVNNEKDMRKVLPLGCDNITTRQPSMLLEIINK